MSKNKEMEERKKRLKLPFVTLPLPPPQTLEKQKTSLNLTGRYLPRLEKARSFVLMPRDQQLVLNKLITSSVRLFDNMAAADDDMTSLTKVVDIRQQYRSTLKFKSMTIESTPEKDDSDDLTRFISTSGGMRFQFISVLKRNELGETISCLVRRKSSQISSQSSQNLNHHHRKSNKVYMMKKHHTLIEAAANSTTAAGKLFTECCAKQTTTTTCSNLSRIVQTCLSADFRHVYVIREFANETLDDVIRRQRGEKTTRQLYRSLVPTKLVKNWLLQCLTALEYLHTNLNACHANIKPSNVLVSTTSQQVKLADFLGHPGQVLISRLVSSPHNRVYLPLETLDFQRYSPKSDVFSLGALFYELIYGGSFTQVCQQIDEAVIRTRFGSDRDEYIGSVLMASIALDEYSRPNSSELISFLKFFESIDFVRQLKSSSSCFNLAYLIKFRQNSNEKKYLLKRQNMESNKIPIILINDMLLKISPHENLISISRYLVIDDRHLYTLREYLDDFVSLSHRLRQLENERRKLDENILIQRWLSQLIDGLSHLHSNNLLHGNLTLDNVLVRTKDEQIRLTDFGSPINNENPIKSDIHSLGCLLYRCLTFDLTNDIDLTRLDNVDLSSKRAKKLIRQILTNQDSELSLSHLKSQLISPFYMDLSQLDSRRSPLETDRKILALEAIDRDRDEFLAITSKRKRNNQISIGLCRVKFNRSLDSNNNHQIDGLNFNSGLLMTRNRSTTSLCSCSKQLVSPSSSSSSSKQADSFIDLQSSLVPRVMCMTTTPNLLVGSNSSQVYFFDSRLKYVRRMCLLEMLENTPLKKQQQQTSTSYRCRHSSMVKKNELKLEVSAMCVDKFATTNCGFRLYLVTTVLREICILNVVYIDLTEFNKQAFESSSPIESPIDPNITVENSIHLSILKPEMSSKSIKCNQNFLFVCERGYLIRVFSKKTFKFLFNLDASNSKNPSPVIVDELRPTTFTYGQYNQVQDLDVDERNGYVYVAYEHAIKVFDETCELIWEFNFESSKIGEVYNGKLSNICLASNGSMLLAFQDSKNEFLYRMSIFN